MAPPLSDFGRSTISSMSTSLTSPRPSQRGHIPPVISNDRRSLTVFPPFSNVTAPPPRTDGTLKEKACGEPTCGCPSRERSEEHTSELQSLMRISYAVFCLKKKK